MEAKEARQILNNLYGLLMEMNLLQSDEDLATEVNLSNDPFLKKHLKKIKLLSAQYAAISNKNAYQSLKDELLRLKKTGLEEIKKILSNKDVAELQPLFRKFEEITPEDEKSIIEDQEFLQMMEYLKKRLDDNK